MKSHTVDRHRFIWIPLTLLLLAACQDGVSTGPDPAPPPPVAAGANLAVFTDAQTGTRTSDVRDVDNEFVRFDLDDGTLIWTATDETFTGWLVNGDFLDPARQYRVRFGTVNDERRAYFTESGRGTICDLSVVDGRLVIEPTDFLPPE